MSPPKRSKSSRQWLDEHFKDAYVQQAQKEQYRSRASYKLLEIEAKDRILKPGMTVVDLGAAPGGWSQVTAEKVGSNGKVIALDILPMDPIANVQFIHGDFTEQAVLEQLLRTVGELEVKLVLSDMAPNISGMKSVDQPRAIYLAELAFDLAQNVLSKEGTFLVKVFQGEGFDHYLKQLRLHFARVVSRKPAASRPRSREIYLLAKGFLG